MVRIAHERRAAAGRQDVGADAGGAVRIVVFVVSAAAEGVALSIVGFSFPEWQFWVAGFPLWMMATLYMEATK